jgi:hypothetical protein
MIHVVVMKCLIDVPLLIHIELHNEGFGVGVLKIEVSESELLCTDCTALDIAVTRSHESRSCENVRAEADEFAVEFGYGFWFNSFSLVSTSLVVTPLATSNCQKQ